MGVSQWVRNFYVVFDFNVTCEEKQNSNQIRLRTQEAKLLIQVLKLNKFKNTSILTEQKQP